MRALRRIWISALAAVIVALVPTGAAAAAATGNAPKAAPKLVCISGGHWVARYKPRRCYIHHAGKNFVWPWVELYSHLRWQHWTRKSAAAKGRQFAEGDRRPARVKLFRPKKGWAPGGGHQRYFSRARFHVHGHGRTFSYLIRLDVPHSNTIH